VSIATAAPSLRRIAALGWVALAVFAAVVGWREWRTRQFESSVLRVEVENRHRMADVLLAPGERPPDPGFSAGTAIASELRARWWLAWADRASSADMRRRAWQDARDELRQAVARRPGSPFAWAALATVKWRLGNADAEFGQALAQAMSLGPNEARVQRQLLGALLSNADRAAPWLEREARTLARGIARRDPYVLIAQANRYHAVPWLCADPQLGHIVREYCGQQGLPLHREARHDVQFPRNQRSIERA